MVRGRSDRLEKWRNVVDRKVDKAHEEESLTLQPSAEMTTKMEKVIIRELQNFYSLNMLSYTTWDNFRYNLNLTLWKKSSIS